MRVKHFPGQWVPTGHTKEVTRFVCEAGHERSGCCGSNAAGERGQFCGHDINPEGTRCHRPGRWQTIQEPETRWEKGHTEVRCDCGRKVHCSEFTNGCDCGRDYNWNGQLLAPRQHWGEETGEHWSECW